VRTLPEGWDIAIHSRASCILESLGLQHDREQNWFQLVSLLSEQTNGDFYSWLAITGRYPTKLEIERFRSKILLNGLNFAVQVLIQNQAKHHVLARYFVAIRFVATNADHVVDVTHTFSAPYLTGIQRVVLGITEGAANITTFVWMGENGIAQPKSLFKRESMNDESAQNREDWQIRLINRLHSYVPRLEKFTAYRVIKHLILPSARRMKRFLIASYVNDQINNEEDKHITNLLFIGKRLTIPEIPSKIEHISIYQAIQESNITPTQVILYDFIPFFHAWTVHPGNRGHLNSYIRIVLLASKVISISRLVNEQAKLITGAFRMERKIWSNHTQEFDYMNLPSGLQGLNSESITKVSNLVVMAGSVEPRKNHLQFLDALEYLANMGKNVKAEILGSAGWENDFILLRIEELQAKGLDVERVGNLKDAEMRLRIAKAQALVQISEAEGFGLPVVEALELGTRVIVSDIAPLNENRSRRITTINLGDIRGLAKAIEEVIDNPESTGEPVTGNTKWIDWQAKLFK
jgi:alpha-1,2-rhamnosyltransferase